MKTGNSQIVNIGKKMKRYKSEPTPEDLVNILSGLEDLSEALNDYVRQFDLFVHNHRLVEFMQNNPLFFKKVDGMFDKLRNDMTFIKSDFLEANIEFEVAIDQYSQNYKPEKSLIKKAVTRAVSRRI